MGASRPTYKKNRWNCIYIFFVKSNKKGIYKKPQQNFLTHFQFAVQTNRDSHRVAYQTKTLTDIKQAGISSPFELHDGICHYRLMLSLLSVRISILQEHWNRCAQLKRALVHIHCNAESCVRALVSNWIFNYVKLIPL